MRERRKAETRRGILEAAGRLMLDAGLGELSFAAVAREAGLPERTVYRHFPNRDALLDGLWQWIDQRIGLNSFPATEADLLAAPARVFPAFDDNESLMRALWATPQGREFRLRVNDRRQAAIRNAVADAVANLPEHEARRIAAAAQLLYSGAAWQTMKDYWGFTGREAGEASAFALELLLDAARHRAFNRKDHDDVVPCVDSGT